VLHREKKLGKPQEKLQKSTAEVATLSDLKNAVLREARKANANNKQLLKHHDAAVAKSTGLVELFKELKNDSQKDCGNECFKTRPSAKGRP